MWPRLGKITALVSVVASCFALLWQIQQFRKECSAHLSLTQCIWEVLVGATAKADGGGGIEDTQLDEEAWRVASGEDTPEAYWQYLNHPWTQHAGQAKKRVNELAETDWRREVRNTDNEEMLERFKDRYKEGHMSRLLKRG